MFVAFILHGLDTQILFTFRGQGSGLTATPETLACLHSDTLHVCMHTRAYLSAWVKAGSQFWCKAMRWVRNSQKYSVSSEFFATKCMNAMQGNAWIGFDSILALRCTVRSVNAWLTQRNARSCIVLWTNLNSDCDFLSAIYSQMKQMSTYIQFYFRYVEAMTPHYNYS